MKTKLMTSLDNAYDHIQHEAYNDALSSILEAKQTLKELESKRLKDVFYHGIKGK